ncbi:hypothetical protein [Nonomuraea glycinis]|uniref:hypothetical protein n=1 Tax=Nonomuraea glycinis TaxID=2047744 RepID=UPI002E0FE900|nr:hypothetical protein OHA68_16500 [Nonomuraea glycinis]
MTDPRSRLIGVLLLTSLVAMMTAAVIVVPSGLTLNPADPATTLTAVAERTDLHLIELAFDVLGWLTLTAAGLAMTARPAGGLPAPTVSLAEPIAAGLAMTARPGGPMAGGLLAAAGLAGLLHDAGNLALTQLAATTTAASAALAVMLTAKWMVNLAGLLWVAATVAAATGSPMSTRLRVAGLVAALSGLAAVVLPWTTGTAGPTAALEQLGYVLHLPIMLWYGVLGWRSLRSGRLRLGR